jgi:uncharacterized protein (TIGR00255 family)
MQSMTGYGIEYADIQGEKFVCIIKSLNSKYLDIFFDLPDEIIPLEPKMKKEIKKRINRGKIEVIIRKQSRSKPIISFIFRIRNEEKLKDEIFSLFLSALAKLVESREEEGEAIKEEIEDRIKKLKNIISEIEIIHRNFPSIIKNNLKERLNQIKEELGIQDIPESVIDSAGVVHIVRKADISEEISRIKAHINSFEEELKGDGDGRKLMFISQEILREFNTIGSKSLDIKISEKVIEAKMEIERIREQLHNIE